MAKKSASARKRARRRRTSGWLLLLFFLIGLAAGILLCYHANVVPAIRSAQAGGFRAGLQTLVRGEVEMGAPTMPPTAPDPTPSLEPEDPIVTEVTPIVPEATAEETAAPAAPAPTEAAVTDEPVVTEAPVTTVAPAVTAAPVITAVPITPAPTGSEEALTEGDADQFDDFEGETYADEGQGGTAVFAIAVTKAPAVQETAVTAAPAATAAPVTPAPTGGEEALTEGDADQFDDFEGETYSDKGQGGTALFTISVTKAPAAQVTAVTAAPLVTAVPATPAPAGNEEALTEEDAEQFDDFGGETYSDKGQGGTAVFTIAVTKAPTGQTTQSGSDQTDAREETGAEETPAPAEGQIAYGRTEALAPGAWFHFTAETEEGPVELAIRVTAMLKPEDYAERYAEAYNLYGMEAAVELEVRNGSDRDIALDEIVSVAFAAKDDTLYPGAYPLSKEPMTSEYDSTVAAGETARLYKRFSYNEERVHPFLTVTFVLDGMPQRTYFNLMPLK